MSQRGGTFLITPQALADALGLPDGTTVDNIRWTWAHEDDGRIRVFVVNHPSLPVIPEGAEWPQVTLQEGKLVR